MGSAQSRSRSVTLQILSALALQNHSRRLNCTSSTMSDKHLTTGEPLPPLKDGSVRLFSMKYCPFAHRPRLVLHAKKVEYEEINCQLLNKPEFLVERNPEGKVPVFEHEGKVVVESNVICDLVDSLYPNPPLYPSDPYLKAKDRISMERYSSKVISVFYQSIRSAGENKEAVDKLLAALELIQADLAGRGTPFFGGDQPNMVDYCSWPFNERIMAFDVVYELVKEKLPTLDAYYQRMANEPAVKAVSTSKDVYHKFFKGYLTGSFEYEF